MCHLLYSHYACNHGTLIFAEDIESCPNRILHPDGPGYEDSTECPFLVAECEGFNDYYCDDCGEFLSLEAGLEEM